MSANRAAGLVREAVNGQQPLGPSQPYVVLDPARFEVGGERRRLRPVFLEQSLGGGPRMAH